MFQALRNAKPGDQFNVMIHTSLFKKIEYVKLIIEEVIHRSDKKCKVYITPEMIGGEMRQYIMLSIVDYEKLVVNAELEDVYVQDEKEQIELSGDTTVIFIRPYQPLWDQYVKDYNNEIDTHNRQMGKSNVDELLREERRLTQQARAIHIKIQYVKDYMQKTEEKLQKLTDKFN